jgi:GT2 family glycosyltransferase
MKLSIIICTRNRANFLAPMLDAIRLLESEQEFEVLLVDNASTDHTGEIVKDAARAIPSVRAVCVERIGLGKARDAAWRQAKGDIVLFTDDDCYVSPDLVDATLGVFEDNPHIGFAGGRIMLHDPTDYPITIDERTHEAAIEPRSFVFPGALQGANMAFRRSALEAIGGIDTDLGAGTPFPCEDIDAVAACAWAGLPGKFDPRMVVRHHHGRKEKDYPQLMASYDRGRGAYFAKYLLRADSRMAYWKGWLSSAFTDVHRGSLATLRRELASARNYVAHRRAWPAMVIGAPIAAATFAALLGTVAANKISRASRSLLSRPRTDRVGPS